MHLQSSCLAHKTKCFLTLLLSSSLLKVPNSSSKCSFMQIYFQRRFHLGLRCCCFSSLMTYNNITLVILLMKTFLRLADAEAVIPTRLISCCWFPQLARAYMASATMAPREMEHVYRSRALLVSMGTTVTSEMFHVLILR